MKKPIILCADPHNFSKEDLFNVREIALREYHQIPISDGMTRRTPESIQAQAWSKAVVIYLSTQGWELVKKEKVDASS